MTSPKKPMRKRSTGVTPEHKAAAIRIARAQANKYKSKGIDRLADDIAAKALMELSKAMERTQINNPEAFMTWKIKRLVFDAARSEKAESARLKVWAFEMEAIKGRAHQEENHNFMGRFPKKGLSTALVEREEQAMVNLVALAIEEIMPEKSDRAILADRFSGEFETITELARKHKKTPTVMANHLKKLLGTEDEPGAVEPVGFVIHQLQKKTAIEFVREISRLDATADISHPISAAHAHLALAATHSRVHKQQAAMGMARLNWIENHMPSQRGVQNKILHRLIRAACFYVMEPNDARHDAKSDLGLHDDVSVLTAVQRAVAEFGN